MDVRKMLIEITADAVIVHINDEQIGMVQRLDLTVDAEPSTTVNAVLKYWRRIGESEPVKAEELVTGYTGTFGAYVTPFTNRLELAEEPIVFVAEEEL